MTDPQQAHQLDGPVVLVFSPHAGHAANGKTPAELLRAAGVTVGEQMLVSALDHNLPLGTAWRERGFRAVVAAGGDGTIGAVASQIATCDLPLGILPMGTSNDSARSLGVPMDLDEAAAAIAHGIPTKVDVGQALPALTEPKALSPESHNGHDRADLPNALVLDPLHATLAAHGAYFLHALTLGLNVEFARLATDVARRERWGNLTYAASAIEALTQFEPVPMTLRLSGVPATTSNGDRADSAGNLVIHRRALQVAVVNLPVFGGAMNLRLPNAGKRPHLLDVVVIEALDLTAMRETVEGLMAGLTRLRDNLFHLTPNGEHGTAHAELTDEAAGFALPGVHRYQAREAIIETPHDVDATLDGEIRARTPVQVRVSPEPVRVLLPAEAHSAFVAASVGDEEPS